MTRSVRNFVVALVCSASVGASSLAIAQELSGKGSTLAALAYTKWGTAFAAQGGGGLKYDAIGSGGGVQAIRERKADFGASDIPLKLAELEATGLRQFPTLLSAVVPVVNLPGVSSNDLKLDGTTLADIMSGKIKMWNDPAIVKLNSKLALPNLPISVIHRAERSGTTAVFSGYLSSASLDWKFAIGEGQELKWPVGTPVKGTDMGETVKKTAGSIGYLDYADAARQGLSMVSLRNQFDAFVSANPETIKGATKFAEWKKNQFDEDPIFDISLINQPGNKVWPIVTATFILLPKDKKSAEKNKEVLKLFDWALNSGDEALLQSGYIPLPMAVKTMVKGTWKRHFADAGAK